MNVFQKTASCLLVTLLCIVPGCSLLGDEPKAFPWIQDGHQMTYDFVAGPEPLVDPNTGFVYESAQNVTRIVIEEPDYADFQFKKKSPPNNGWKNQGKVGEINMIIDGLYGFPGPKRAEDGIRTEYPDDCDDASDFDSSIRVPAHPEVGNTYPLYACGNEIAETYEVAAVDLTVSVPAGRFENVFVLHNRKQRQKAYWSESEGLLKVERYDEGGQLLGAYVLASKNF